MAASDAGAWARLNLVQGAAEPLRWELDGSRGEARLTVGSDAGCTWRVRDESVAPLHLTLRWDGRHLEVADSHGAGGVRLDGERVGLTFTRVHGRSRIEFGRCAIVAETSGRAGRSTQPPSSGTVPPPSDAVGEGAKRTLMGVAPSSSVPPSGPPDSVKVSRPVRTGVEAAGRDPTPTGMRRSAWPKSTVMGVGPVVAQEKAPEKASGEPASSAPPRPDGSTLYGVGGDDDSLSHPVDFVSPERLRRSSVPPAQDAEDAEAPRKVGRTTRLGFAQDVPQPTGRVTHRGFSDEFVGGFPGDEEPEESPSIPKQALSPSGMPAEDDDGVWPDADEPSQTPWRAKPPSRPESAVWPAVVGIAAVLAFGVWVYALLTL